jgi:ATP/maltotriose-dependent transcriptional regulator MalT
MLRRPDQMASPEITELLTAHGKLPASMTPSSLGHAAANLLVDTIENLRAPEDAPREQKLPHLVLKTCFIDGAKLFQAAATLGVSERQMSRERARAIGLLKAELEGPLRSSGYRGEPVPTIRGFLARPGQARALEEALETSRQANVHGPMGIGKTSLVAELAAEVAGSTPVLWYRMRDQVNVTLNAVLFELGERLRQEGAPELSNFLAQSLPTPDAALATRVALKTLAFGPFLIVFDDYHLAEKDAAILGFVEEMAERLPLLRIVTISRSRHVGTITGKAFEVPPFTRSETTQFLSQLGVQCQPVMVKTLHAWTGGNPHLIQLAASWLKTATDEEISRGVASLNQQEEVQVFLLSYVTDLLGPDDRAILQAASILRDRFSDEALAAVAGRTRGDIEDASLRLSRVYVATRSREGDTAFFHTSVRDYVYSRIEPGLRSELHARAATWYRKINRAEEADYHEARSEQSLDDWDLDFSA